MEAKRSPFALQADDIARLNSSEGFQRIRQILENQHGYPFCNHHEPSTLEDKDTWLLHRDITYALILPILQLYLQASRLAESMLWPRIAIDLELAFQGEARGAFCWLQCLVIDEQDWCHMKGCPACIVTHVLQCEPTIRLVLAASRLSHHIHTSDDNGLNLPTLGFWLRSLRTALDNDPFWGPGHWEDIEARALSLEEGIQQLLRQCRKIRQTIPVMKAGVREKVVPDGIAKITGPTTTPLTRICHSTLAKRQLALVVEEQGWMKMIILACWRSILMESLRERRKDLSTERPLAPARARSLTS